MSKINVPQNHSLHLPLVASSEINWMDFETRMRKMIGQLLTPVMQQ